MRTHMHMRRAWPVLLLTACKLVKADDDAILHVAGSRLGQSGLFRINANGTFDSFVGNMSGGSVLDVYNMCYSNEDGNLYYIHHFNEHAQTLYRMSPETSDTNMIGLLDLSLGSNEASDYQYTATLACREDKLYFYGAKYGGPPDYGFAKSHILFTDLDGNTPQNLNFEAPGMSGTSVADFSSLGKLRALTSGMGGYTEYSIDLESGTTEEGLVEGIDPCVDLFVDASIQPGTETMFATAYYSGDLFKIDLETNEYERINTDFDQMWGISWTPAAFVGSEPTTTTVPPSASPTNASPTNATEAPTIAPTVTPLLTVPSQSPSILLNESGTMFPTNAPSTSPASGNVTENPISTPTGSPSRSRMPTFLPISMPSSNPSVDTTTSTPSVNPTAGPTTKSPASAPTFSPSMQPSLVPSQQPSASNLPSSAASETPSTSSSEVPSFQPSVSDAPSSSPSDHPSSTYSPTAEPTKNPTSTPTQQNRPTAEPTKNPTSSPTQTPTAQETSGILKKSHITSFIAISFSTFALAYLAV